MSDMGKSALLFARDMIEWAWEDGPSTEEAQTILDMATAKGLVHWRKPTQAELNDQEWWGHEFDIGPEDAQGSLYRPCCAISVNAPLSIIQSPTSNDERRSRIRLIEMNAGPTRFASLG